MGEGDLRRVVSTGEHLGHEADDAPSDLGHWQVGRVAVVGAGGFLGGYLLDEVRRVAPTAELVGVIRPGGTRPERPEVRFTTELPSADVVFHVAGGGAIGASLEDPLGDLLRHTGTVVESLERLRRTPNARFVLASSAAVYGPAASPVEETARRRPTSPYGVSKAAAEEYVRVYRDLYGVDGRIARIANPYGPGQRSRVVYDLAVRAISEGAPLVLRGDGRERRDFIHARDVARAMIRIAALGEPGGVYNVGTGRPTELRRLGELVAASCGLPEGSVTTDGKVQPGAVAEFYPSVEKLEALGFRPLVPLPGGIAETVAWIRHERRAARGGP